MPQMNWIYNNTSLAEVIEYVEEVVGTTKEGTILEFRNANGNISSIADSYDNIVNFVNESKVGYTSLGALGSLGINILTGTTIAVGGVLVKTALNNAIAKASVSFGIKDPTARVQDPLNPSQYKTIIDCIIDRLALNKGVNRDRLSTTSVYGYTTDGSTTLVGKNFLEDVAQAVDDLGFTSFLELPEVGTEFNEISNTSGSTLQSDIMQAGTEALEIYIRNNPTSSYSEYAKRVMALLPTLVQRFVNYFATGSGTEPYTYVGAVSAQFPSYYGGLAVSVGVKEFSYLPAPIRVINFNDGVALSVNPYVGEASVITTTYELVDSGTIYSRSSFGLGLTLGKQTSYNNGLAVVQIIKTNSLTKGYAGIDYIGDPLNGSSLEQYPAWLAKALGLFLPLNISSRALTDPATAQDEAQSGAVTDTSPYNGIDPIADVPPSDGTGQQPAPPDPSPEPTPTPVPPFPVIPSYNANKLYTVHTITDDQLDVLGGYLWSSDFVVLIEKMFSQPIDAVLGLLELHYGGNIAVGSSEDIKLGAFSSGATGNKVTNRYVQFSCGTVSVPEYYRNVEDYNPYTYVQIFLPYIGFCNMDTNQIIGSSVEVVYGIDVYTGSCVARVLATKDGVKQELYNFYGQCGLQLPVTSNDYSRLISSIAGIGVGIATGSATTVANQAVSMLGGGARVNYARTNGFNNNVGTMTSQKPFIIIQRPIAFNAYNYQSLYGFPSNWTVKLGQCHGYTRVKDVHVDTVVCTDEEKKEIETLLKTGVII